MCQGFKRGSKYCIICVKNYLLKIMEDIAVGILQSRNFAC